MGAAASVSQDGLPDHLRSIMDLCQRLKMKIAELDNQLIDNESKKMFKGHTKIIDELTARSKLQIKRMLEHFPDSVKNLDTLNDAGNHYAGFIKLLSKSKVEIEIDALKEKPDVDEELLVNIIATSSISELQQLDELFIKEKSFSMGDYFASKCKDDSLLKKFVARIMEFNRDESKQIDQDLAAKQVDILHRAGASRLIGVEEDPIIEILASCSRAQCSAINEIYQEKYRMKLERAINIKFKGNCGKLMVMWTQPLPQAVITCLGYLIQKMLVDKLAIGQLIARFEKDFWQQAEDTCVKLYQKGVADYISKAIGGTYHRALKGWIESPSPDKGYERILELYASNKLPAGCDIAEILGEKDTIDKFQFLLDKQAQELKLFMVAHKIKLDAADLAILSRTNTNSNVLATLRSSPSGSKLNNSSTSSIRSLKAKEVTEEGSDDEVEESKDKFSEHATSSSNLKKIPSEIKRKFTIKLDQPTTAAHEEKSSKVYNYLVSVMEAKDADGEGCFAEEEFWSIIKDLPLNELGMTEQEIDAIRNWSEWEMDGKIYFYEALFEFSESLITSIENKAEGDTDVIRVISKLSGQPTNAFAAVEQVRATPVRRASAVTAPQDYGGFSEKRGTIINQFPQIPLYVRQYLIDTITAFDFDLNGHITEEEITALLQVINIPSLTTAHFFSKKSKLSPKEACDVVCKEIHTWFGDGQEHYICLIDQSSGSYFWFNTYDESTQWADTGAQTGTEESNTESKLTKAYTEAELYVDGDAPRLETSKSNPVM